MKIVLITDDFYPNLGGISHTLMNLYKNFQDKEHTLYIFNPYSKFKNVFKVINRRIYNKRDLKYLLKSRDFYLYLIKSLWSIIRDKRTPLVHRFNIILYLFSKPSLLMRIIENVKQLYPYLENMNFDIILGSHSGWILPLNFILSRIFKKKLITLAHGNDFLIRNPLTLKTYFFKNTDKIILSNNLMKDLIKKIHHLNENQLAVVYRGIDANSSQVKESKKELRKKFNINEDQFVLLSVGRHVPRKNFDLVIKAVYETKKLKPSINLKYFLIGEGTETVYLKNLVKQLNLENEVEFLGPCDATKRNEFYKLSDIFLMPVIKKEQNIEGFGIVFIESNFYKVPVIGTKTGGIVEAIIDGVTGFLIDSDNLNQLVEKILFLYENEEIRKEMGEKGHKRVIKEFLWEKIVDDYIKIFRNVLST
ncbi:MAG: glycosyltransferase family 4 protein [Promethearchaeota archaeon]